MVTVLATIRHRARDDEVEEKQAAPPAVRSCRRFVDASAAAAAAAEEEEDRRPRSRRFEVGPCDKDIEPRVPKPGELEACFQAYLHEKRAPVDEATYEDEIRRVGAEANDDDDDCSPAALYDRLVARLRQKTEDADRACDIRRRQDLSTDLLRDLRRSAGDLRLAAIQRTLNNMGYTRSVHQRLFHERFIEACLPMYVIS